MTDFPRNYLDLVTTTRSLVFFNSSPHTHYQSRIKRLNSESWALITRKTTNLCPFSKWPGDHFFDYKDQQACWLLSWFFFPPIPLPWVIPTLLPKKAKQNSKGSYQKQICSDIKLFYSMLRSFIFDWLIFASCVWRFCLHISPHVCGAYRGQKRASVERIQDGKVVLSEGPAKVCH